MWKIFKLGQGPRPDLLAEQWAREAAEEEARERQQEEPHYAELCRRFLADQEDFSEENLKNAHITHRFQNTDLHTCLDEIKLFIQNQPIV